MLVDSTLFRLMQDGGWVMWGLLVFSFTTVAVAVQRALVLRRAGGNPARLFIAVQQALLRDGSRDKAVVVCRNTGGVVASLLVAGLSRADEPQERLERVLEGAAGFELRRLGRGLGILSTVAVTAPLLGFLGTVTGMMASFQAFVEHGINNPAMVALGISEALTTTAGGLVVAIPAQLLYQALAGRLHRIEGDLEAAANFLVDVLYRPDLVRITDS
jgi:biopolymer transport protein ExbB